MAGDGFKFDAKDDVCVEVSEGLFFKFNIKPAVVADPDTAANNFNNKNQ